MDTNDISTVIYFLIALIGCGTGIYGFSRSRKNDIREDTKELANFQESLLKLNMKTDQICVTTNETRTDIKAMQMKIQDLDKEISIVKRDLHTAFDRIDELKEKVE